MRTIVCLFAAFALVAALSGCPGPGHDAQQVQGLTLRSLGHQVLSGAFSMQAGGEVLRVLYPDRETFSLTLLTVPVPPGEAEPAVDYLDRLSDDPHGVAGNELLLVDAGAEHVFYADRSSSSTEEPPTKWVSRPAGQDYWWIDLLPYTGQLVAALPEEGAQAGSPSIRLFFASGSTLSSATTSGTWDPREVIAPFRQRGRVSVLGALAGFVVYEGYSNQLLLVREAGGKISTRRLFAGGQVHEAAAGADGTLAVILFDSGAEEILLLEGDAKTGGAMRVTPVTPARGTSAVYYARVGQNRLFLFDERRLEDPEGSYELSLLVPQGSGYAKKILLRGLAAPLDFQAAAAGESFYVVFDGQKGLQLLQVPLEAVLGEAASSGS